MNQHTRNRTYSGSSNLPRVISYRDYYNYAFDQTVTRVNFKKDTDQAENEAPDETFVRNETYLREKGAVEIGNVNTARVSRRRRPLRITAQKRIRDVDVSTDE